jgi:hypothetical protein
LGWEEEGLYAVNPLLKQPLFEIKEIEIEEIQRIEKDLAAQYSYDDYELFFPRLNKKPVASNWFYLW